MASCASAIGRTKNADIDGPANTTCPARRLRRRRFGYDRAGDRPARRIFTGKNRIRHSPDIYRNGFPKLGVARIAEYPLRQNRFYGELARKLGCPKAVRAVAAANGANPISIFVPCHRVIGSDRKLVGYGGDWKPRKVCWPWNRPPAAYSDAVGNPRTESDNSKPQIINLAAYSTALGRQAYSKR